MNIRRFIALTIAVVFLGATGLVTAAEGYSKDIGKKEFQNNCAICHGLSGKGNGSFAELLKQAPSDLTLISKRNGGVYPLIKVYNLISGVDRIASHGTLEMPIWGQRYNQKFVQEPESKDAGPSQSVRERILELVFYIGTLQQVP